MAFPERLLHSDLKMKNYLARKNVQAYMPSRGHGVGKGRESWAVRDQCGCRRGLSWRWWAKDVQDCPGYRVQVQAYESHGEVWNRGFTWLFTHAILSIYTLCLACVLVHLFLLGNSSSLGLNLGVLPGKPFPISFSFIYIPLLSAPVDLCAYFITFIVPF